MGLPLATYLLKVYLDALPEELFEAARIDGAGDLRIYLMLAFPLLKPGLATVAVFSALAVLERVPARAALHPGRFAQDHPDRASRLLEPVRHRLQPAVLGAVDHHSPDDRRLRQASKIGIASVADFCRDPHAFDAEASWERALRVSRARVMPSRFEIRGRSAGLRAVR